MTVDLFRAATPAVLGTCTGLALGYFIYKQFVENWYGEFRKTHTPTKIKYWLGVISCFSIALGTMQIANELFYVAFNDSNIRAEIIYKGVHTLIDLPIILSIVSFLITKFWKSSSFQSTADEEKCYEEALNELKQGTQRTGLWAKCIANTNGDENKAKSEYIKVRVSEMHTSSNSQIKIASKNSQSINLKPLIFLFLVLLTALVFYVFINTNKTNDKKITINNCNLCVMSGNCEPTTYYNFLNVHLDKNGFELKNISNESKLTEKTIFENAICNYNSITNEIQCFRKVIGNTSTEFDDFRFNGKNLLTKKNVITNKNGEQVLSSQLTCSLTEKNNQ